MAAVLAIGLNEVKGPVEAAASGSMGVKRLLDGSDRAVVGSVDCDDGEVFDRGLILVAETAPALVVSTMCPFIVSASEPSSDGDEDVSATVSAIVSAMIEFFRIIPQRLIVRSPMAPAAAKSMKENTLWRVQPHRHGARRYVRARQSCNEAPQ